MAMRRNTVGLFLACAMLIQGGRITPAAASDQSGGASAQVSDKAALVDILTERGMAQDEATAAVNSLTPDDVRVLVENPEMLQAAGDDGTSVLAAVGIVLLILLLIAAAAA